MAVSSTSFKENNTAGYLPRRRHSEKLVYSQLKDYGDEMFGVLVTEARTAKESADRIRAADRFLSHTLLQPKPDENIENNQGIKATTIELMEQMRSINPNVPIEAYNLLIDSLNSLLEKKKLEEEQGKFDGSESSY